MLCPNCGRDVGGEAKLCEACTAMLDPDFSYGEEEESSVLTTTTFFGGIPVGHAGFWLRFFAGLIDMTLVLVVSKSIESLLTRQITITLFGILGVSAYQSVYVFGFGPLPYGLFSSLVIIFIGWLYFSLLESSRLQATFGKFLFSIAVTDEDWARISFVQASERYASKAISALLVGVGFLFPAFTKEKQALHDLIAGTLVEKKKELKPFRLIITILVSFIFLALGHYYFGVKL